MKFSTNAVTRTAEILYNDHYVAIPFDCTKAAVHNDDGIIPAGTIMPDNNDDAIGVLLHDVNMNENPNGTVVIHGFIKADKLPVAVTVNAAEAMFGRVVFMNADGTINLGEVAQS